MKELEKQSEMTVNRLVEETACRGKGAINITGRVDMLCYVVEIEVKKKNSQTKASDGEC